MLKMPNPKNPAFKELSHKHCPTRWIVLNWVNELFANILQRTSYISAKNPNCDQKENMPWGKVCILKRKIGQAQPHPQALRFSHRRGERETRDWWWTARLSPSRLSLRAHFHRERDVWVRGRVRRTQVASSELCLLATNRRRTKIEPRSNKKNE